MSIKFVCWLLVLITAGMVLRAESVVKNNDKIAFLGDSITAQGNQYKGGYVNLIMDALAANNIKATKIPVARNGQKSNQLLARLDAEVIAKKPQILVVSCGINDVASGKAGVRLGDFKKNMRSIVEKAQASGIKVCIITATMIKEDAGNKYNKTLKLYNDSLIELAAEKHCLLADANAEMQKQVAFYRSQQLACKGNQLTYDGTHMNARGNIVIAGSVLRAFGFSDEEIRKAEKIWGAKPAPIGNLQISLGSWNKLSVKAADKHMTIQNYIMFLVKYDAAGKKMK